MHKKLVALFVLVHPHPDLGIATLAHGSRKGMTLTDLGDRAKLTDHLRNA